MAYCTQSSDKIIALKSEISTIDVYNYRIARGHPGVLCKGCWAVTCNTQPSIYLNHLEYPRIAGILYSSHIIALDLFCCHCSTHSYPCGIRFLQLCPVIQRNINKADLCGCWEMAAKKKSKSRRKPSVKFWFLKLTRNQLLRLVMLLNWRKKRRRRRRRRKWRRRRQWQQQQASAEHEPQAATSGGGLPTWGPPQESKTNIHHKIHLKVTNIHPFVSAAKGMKKSEAPNNNKDSSPLSVLTLFFTEIFHLLVEQPTYTTSNTYMDKADLAADCLTLRCRTWFSLL